MAMRKIIMAKKSGSKEKGSREFLKSPEYGIYSSRICNANTIISSEYPIRINSALYL
jgi:hypothetical protein